MELNSTAGPRPPATPAVSRRLRIVRGGWLRDLAPVLTLVVLTTIVAAREPAFVSERNLLNVADASAPLFLLALGETVIVLMGSIDLSLHTIASLSSVLAALWIDQLGPFAAPAGVLVGTACGFINGLLYTRLRIPSFITTLGTFGLWKGIALTISNAQPVPIPTKIGGSFGWLKGDSLGFPNTAWTGLAMLAVTFVILRHTALGRYIYAIGIGEQATWLSGVPVQRYKLSAFIFAGFCAGLAGVVLVAQLRSGGPSLADSLLLPAIAAVIVGGTAITGGIGGVARTLVGALIIIVARVGMDSAGVDVFAQQMVYGVIVIVAVTLTIDRSKIAMVK